MTTGENDTLGSYFYATYLAFYLLKHELNGAKYLWKRSPERIKKQSSKSMLFEMWEVGKAMWNNEVPLQLSLLSADWPQELHPIVCQLKEDIIQRTFTSISNSYELIHVDQLSQMLNLPTTSIGQRKCRNLSLFD